MLRLIGVYISEQLTEYIKVVFTNSELILAACNARETIDFTNIDSVSFKFKDIDTGRIDSINFSEVSNFEDYLLNNEIFGMFETSFYSSTCFVVSDFLYNFLKCLVLGDNLNLLLSSVYCCVSRNIYDWRVPKFAAMYFDDSKRFLILDTSTRQPVFFKLLEDKNIVERLFLKFKLIDSKYYDIPSSIIQL